jgi:tRNA pseudouridine32 synthase/23S rRNA pseudouridine746 synthase
MFIYAPPTELWLSIVEEDDDILIANKPAGLLSVPGREPQHYDSLWSRLVESYPGIQIVHRLDVGTSGLLLFAKTKAAESALKKQFQYRLTHKIYYARVWGHPTQEQGEIDLPLIRDWANRPRQKVCHETGKQASTAYSLLQREVQTSIVQLLPFSGRTHQLRVHMAAIGHPIVGDDFYAHDEAHKFSSRLELHAAELSFYHPRSDKLSTCFVPCPFYPEASAQIIERFHPAEKRPDYKEMNL